MKEVPGKSRGVLSPLALENILPLIRSTLNYGINVAHGITVAPHLKNVHIMISVLI